MPKVGKEEFPYTKEGVKQAIEKSADTGIPISNGADRSVQQYAGGGLTGFNAIGQPPMYHEGGKTLSRKELHDRSAAKKEEADKKTKAYEDMGKEIKEAKDAKKDAKSEAKKTKKLAKAKSRTTIDKDTGKERVATRSERRAARKLARQNARDAKRQAKDDYSKAASASVDKMKKAKSDIHMEYLDKYHQGGSTRKELHEKGVARKEEAGEIKKAQEDRTKAFQESKDTQKKAMKTIWNNYTDQRWQMNRLRDDYNRLNDKLIQMRNSGFRIADFEAEVQKLNAEITASYSELQ